MTKEEQRQQQLRIAQIVRERNFGPDARRAGLNPRQLECGLRLLDEGSREFRKRLRDIKQNSNPRMILALAYRR